MNDIGADFEVSYCAPFQGVDNGTSFTCRGAGTGWFVTDTVGVGERTACVKYTAASVPINPTSADCGAISLEAVPFNIPHPIACCSDQAGPGSILETCGIDCGYAACKIAVAKLRESAAALVPPKGPENAPYKRARADLYEYADYLESPEVMDYCAHEVAAGDGEVVALGLGEGSSTKGQPGHIKSARLYLSCALDAAQPYVQAEDAGVCDAASNIPQSP